VNLLEGENEMKRKDLIALVLLTILVLLLPLNITAQESEKEKSKLAVLWTSGDPDVAHRMVLMYTHRAKQVKWFDEVTLIVWGPSQRLLVGDKDLQGKIKAMQEEGIIVEACIACAMGYGIVNELRGLGIPVKGMGQPLTDYLKSDWKVLTF
jgi:hypothetical protein